MKFKVKLLTPTAKVPAKENYKDAGFDIYSDENITIGPGETVRVKTGIAIQPENPDIFKIVFENIRERSGLASKSVRVGGGIVDEIYVGEVQVIIQNLNIANILNDLIWRKTTIKEMPNYLYKHNLVIKKGDKIAQFIPMEVIPAELVVVDELEETNRGSKGFGSSDNN